VVVVVDTVNDIPEDIGAGARRVGATCAPELVGLLISAEHSTVSSSQEASDAALDELKNALRVGETLSISL
jgi:hypothetical protein